MTDQLWKVYRTLQLVRSGRKRTGHISAVTSNKKKKHFPNRVSSAMAHHCPSHITFSTALPFKVLLFMSLVIRKSFCNYSKKKKKGATKRITFKLTEVFFRFIQKGWQTSFFWIYYLWEWPTQNVSSTMVCCDHTSHHHCLSCLPPVRCRKNIMRQKLQNLYVYLENYCGGK